MAADGTLTLKEDLVVADSTDSAFISFITIDREGRFLYTSSKSKVVTYGIASDGSLTFLSEVSLQYGVSMHIDRSGRYAYIVTQKTFSVPADMYAYSIGSNGALQALAHYDIHDNDFFSNIAISGDFLYSNDESVAGMDIFRIDDDGSLTPQPPFVHPEPLPPFSFADSMVVDASQRFLYGAPTDSQNILHPVYAIQADGSLSLIQELDGPQATVSSSFTKAIATTP
jgi:6-phosphogluconolactonase (cycloisomerase 2 family)